MKPFGLFSLFLFTHLAFSQSLPPEWRFSPDNHRLLIGNNHADGLYDSATFRSVYLNFPQSNYWQLLTQNYNTHTDLQATMTVDGVVYDSVGVRFKGQTSYTQVSGQKKSFNISLDYNDPDLDIMGYQTLNLNNAFGDRSFIREVMFENLIKKHIPAAKANHVHLYVNNQDFGIYTNVQQLNKDFLKEWFFSNDGVNWRADAPPGSPPGQPGWGNGTSALNYLGTDTADYQQYYTLKSNDIVSDPWQKLITVCDKLNNTPLANLPNVLPDYMDVDRTLWFLASENAFSDDDSYIHKGEMDYYVYYEPETGRLTPQEFDANSVMGNMNVNWSPFYKQTDVNYPLLNKMLSVPEWRQRYLAHFRTILNDEMNPTVCNPIIDQYYAHVDSLVNADPIKLYTYSQFLNEKQALKNFVQNRYNNMMANNEVNQPSPVFALCEYRDTNAIAWNPPVHLVGTDVSAQISFVTGLSAVKLWVGTGWVGNFTAYTMYDDGLHQDGASGDGLYGAHIPGYQAGTVVRFYFEAMAANPQFSASYFPAGAEHDVFYYIVAPISSGSSQVVLNELMASNTATVADNTGEYDDWIELYNQTSSTVDLSGWFISDNPANLDKWEIPAGTQITGNGYAIFWADEDSSQGPNHMNFKLSAAGEVVYLLNPSLLMMDSVTFGVQTTDMGFARVPNGTGPFVIQLPTFNGTNDAASVIERKGSGLMVYPNPADEFFELAFEDAPKDCSFRVFDAHGALVLHAVAKGGKCRIDCSHWSSGVYHVVNQHGLSQRIQLLH